MGCYAQTLRRYSQARDGFQHAPEKMRWSRHEQRHRGERLPRGGDPCDQQHHLRGGSAGQEQQRQGEWVDELIVNE